MHWIKKKLRFHRNQKKNTQCKNQVVCKTFTFMFYFVFLRLADLISLFYFILLEKLLRNRNCVCKNVGKTQQLLVIITLKFAPENNTILFDKRIENFYFSFCLLFKHSIWKSIWVCRFNVCACVLFMLLVFFFLFCSLQLHW